MMTSTPVIPSLALLCSGDAPLKEPQSQQLLSRTHRLLLLPLQQRPSLLPNTETYHSVRDKGLMLIETGWGWQTWLRY